MTWKHQRRKFVVTQTSRVEWGEDLKVQAADSAQSVDWEVIEVSGVSGRPLNHKKATHAAEKRT